MTLRTILFWLHLAAGCVAGLIILIMSVTGVLLTYERQMLARADRGNYRTAPLAGVARLTPDALLNRYAAQKGALPRSAVLVLRSDPAEPAEVTLGPEGSLYLDPSDGRVLGRHDGETRRSFQKIRAWHRWLGSEGEGRALGKAITGACNFAFLFIVLSGLYLWLPKLWTWQHLRPIVWFKGGVAGKARDFNWHNTAGFWTALPLAIVVACALPISYQWASQMVYRITGSEVPGPPAPPNAGPERRGEPTATVERPKVDELWLRAEKKVPGWQSISFPVPSQPRGVVPFTIDTGDGGQPHLRSTLTLDLTTGEERKWETFADGSAGRRLRAWTRFTHTGEYYGLPGQTIAGVASLAGVLLVWTGIALTLRRFNAWRRRRARQPAAAATAG